MIYLDASALVPIVRIEDHSSIVGKMLFETSDITTSDFAVGEASSAVARLVRMRQITSDLGWAMLAKLDEWAALKAVVHQIRMQDVRLATQFVRRFDTGLRLPDAIHLAICRRIDVAILTFDDRLSDAAVELHLAVAAKPML